MAGGCGVGAFCSFCGKCGRVFGAVFEDIEIPVVAPPGTSSLEATAKKSSFSPDSAKAETGTTKDPSA